MAAGGDLEWYINTHFYIDMISHFTIRDVHVNHYTSNGLGNNIRRRHHLQQILLLRLIQVAPLPQVALLAIGGTNGWQTQSLGEALHRFRGYARFGGVQDQMRRLFLFNTCCVLIAN